MGQPPSRFHPEHPLQLSPSMQQAQLSFLSVLAFAACLHAAPPVAVAPPAVSAAPPAVVVAATPTPTVETPARVVPTECTEAAAATFFEVTGDDSWRTLCNELDGARYLTAWHVTVGDTSTATLRIARVANGAVTWEATGEMTPPAVGDTWTAEPVLAVPGAPGGLLVSVAGEVGEDYYTRSSLAVVFRPTASGFERVWAGVGDQVERSMDACFRVTTRGFRFVDAGTLSVSHARSARFIRQDLDADLLRTLRRECTPEPRRVSRVALAR